MMPTAVFLPGTLCDAQTWRESAQALAQRLPCRHAEYGRAASIAAMAARVLADFHGPLVPVGSSMGGIVALEMLRQAPERIVALALFGVNPGADTPPRHAARLEQLRCAREQGVGALARDLLAPAWFVTGGKHYAQLSGAAAGMAERVGLACLEAQFDALAGRVDSWPLLPHIKVPVLVAYGQHDQICPKAMQEDMTDLLAHARLEEIVAAGHLAPMEQPAACAAVLDDWLTPLLSQAG